MADEKRKKFFWGEDRNKRNRSRPRKNWLRAVNGDFKASMNSGQGNKTRHRNRWRMVVKKIDIRCFR